MRQKLSCTNRSVVVRSGLNSAQRLRPRSRFVQLGLQLLHRASYRCTATSRYWREAWISHAICNVETCGLQSVGADAREGDDKDAFGSGACISASSRRLERCSWFGGLHFRLISPFKKEACDSILDIGLKARATGSTASFALTC